MKKIMILPIVFMVSLSFSQDTTYILPTVEIDSATLYSGASVLIPEIRYELGKSTLQKASIPQIEIIVEFMREHPNLILEVSTHMDSRGSNMACMSLSQRRADSVVAKLVELGIDQARLVPKGYGETKPTTFEGNLLTEKYINSFKENDKPTYELLHQKNRRVELRIISYGYVPKEPKRTLEAPFRLNE